jgi:hypothetical protein
MSEVARDTGSPAPPAALRVPATTLVTLSQYDESGVDLSLIRANMKLTPEERACRAERARKAAPRVQQIGRDSRREPA